MADPAEADPDSDADADADPDSDADADADPDLSPDDRPETDVAPGAVDADLADVESTLEEELDEKPPLADLIVGLREETDDSLRYVVRYTEDGHELLYVRSDVAESNADAALLDRVEWLVLKALGDPTDDRTLSTYGHLDAVMRWYEERLVTVYPTGEWSGVITVLDRTRSPVVDRVLDDLPDADP